MRNWSTNAHSKKGKTNKTYQFSYVFCLKSENKKYSSSWFDVRSEFNINTNSFSPNALIKLYIWNKSKKEFYIDDIEIIYYGRK